MILAVDTSLGTAVAVVDLDGTALAERSAPDPIGHAEVIGTLMQEVLTEAGDPHISHVAVGMGPGPFTGLRIGIAAARAFALARSATLIPVVSHDAIAFADSSDAPFAVVTDARRREVAFTRYARSGSASVERISEPALAPRADIDTVLADVPWAEARMLSAAALGAVAAHALAAGSIDGPQEPLYLRSPDVAAPKVRS